MVAEVVFKGLDQTVRTAITYDPNGKVGRRAVGNLAFNKIDGDVDFCERISSRSSRNVVNESKVRLVDINRVAWIAWIKPEIKETTRAPVRITIKRNSSGIRNSKRRIGTEIDTQVIFAFT